MNGLTIINRLATITKKIFIAYRKFCFVHIILITNQAALEKIESHY